MGIGNLVEILKDRMSSKEGMHQDNSNIQRTKLLASKPAKARIPHTLEVQIMLLIISRDHTFYQKVNSRAVWDK